MSLLAKCLSLLTLACLFCSIASAQADPILETGIRPYGAYSQDFETISMVNGGMSIRIPLLSYPQRGNKLKLDFQLIYMDAGWSVVTSGSAETVGYGGNASGRFSSRIFQYLNIAMGRAGRGVLISFTGLRS
jgi:hypothetical protein